MVVVTKTVLRGLKDVNLDLVSLYRSIRCTIVRIFINVYIQHIISEKREMEVRKCRFGKWKVIFVIFCFRCKFEHN